jgi:hypothetical protein
MDITKEGDQYVVRMSSDEAASLRTVTERFKAFSAGTLSQRVITWLDKFSEHLPAKP